MCSSHERRCRRSADAVRTTLLCIVVLPCLASTGCIGGPPPKTKIQTRSVFGAERHNLSAAYSYGECWVGLVCFVVKPGADPDAAAAQLSESEHRHGMPCQHPYRISAREMLAILQSVNSRANYNIISEEDAAELAGPMSDAFAQATPNEFVDFQAKRILSGAAKVLGDSKHRRWNTTGTASVTSGVMTFRFYGTAEGYQQNKIYGPEIEVRVPVSSNAQKPASGASDPTAPPTLNGYCEECGAETSKDAKFCPKCGKKIVR